MQFKPDFWLIILPILFLQTSFSFSGEIYRWVDERGTVHLTDDRSKIPEPYLDRAERIVVPEETLEENRRVDQPEDKLDRVEEYLKNLNRRIEEKKKVEKRIFELEEELKISEGSLKRIEEYERENYLYYQPFKDPKTGKWIPVASPYHEEKKRLKERIKFIQAELRSLQERLSDINRSL